MNTQYIYEKQGFIVLAYQVKEEYEEELRSRIVRGNTVNGAIPDEAVLAVIGTASPEEWAEQCRLCGDPIKDWSELPHVGYLKVIAE